MLSSPSSAFRAGLARQRVRAETTTADTRTQDIRRLPSVRLLTQAVICRVRDAHNIRVKNQERSYISHSGVDLRGDRHAPARAEGAVGHLQARCRLFTLELSATNQSE